MSAPDRPKDTTADTAGTTLEAAARALLDKLAEMEGPIDAACVIASVHGQPYSGPTWTAERDALEAALPKGGPGELPIFF